MATIESNKPERIEYAKNAIERTIKELNEFFSWRAVITQKDKIHITVTAPKDHIPGFIIFKIANIVSIFMVEMSVERDHRTLRIEIF